MEKENEGRKVNSMRNIRNWVPSFLGSCLSLWCGMSVMGSPGDGITVQNWRLSPFLDLSATYDSNVGIDGTDESDYFTDLWLGTDLLRKTEKLTLQAQVWGKIRNYADQTDQNYEGFGEIIGISYVPWNELRLKLEQHYAQLTDYEYTLQFTNTGLVTLQDKTERQDRERFSIGVGMELPLSDKMTLALDAAYGYVDYDNSATFDGTERTVSLELAYKVTDKTALFVYGDYELLDSDGNDDATIVYALRVGAKTLTTDKLTFRAGAGTIWYKVDNGPGADAESDAEFNFNAQAAWQATPKISIVASARNYLRIAADSADNAKDATEFSLGGNYRLSDSISLSLTGAYSMTEYINPIMIGGNLIDREQDIWMMRTRLTYTPPAQFISFYLDAQYNTVDDNSGDDYDQLRLGAGVRLRY